MSEDNELLHYGTPRKSGRYPWGSGGDTQRSPDFMATVKELKKQGLTDTQIAEGMGINSAQFRARKTIARNELKIAQRSMAENLKDKGWSNVAIGQRMGISEGSVRNLLDSSQKDKLDILQSTADMLRNQVAKKDYIDIGRGVEHDLPIGGTNIGVSKEKLAAAVALLKEEGYTTHYIKVPQLGSKNLTTVKVLAKPDTPYSEVFANRDKIQQVKDYSEDGGRTFTSLRPPTSVNSKRIAVRYAEEGGASEDGVIYLRPGAEGLSLGKSQYAQVRIAVDGTHYLKGMAMYTDDLPDGVDIMFNTNKSDTGNKKDALKPLGDDPVNPFTSSISRQNGHLNIVNEEGAWDKWSKSLSSQVLSKQSPDLAKTQLAMTMERRQRDLKEIMALTNPVVKRKLLESFADDADAAAVHLKAAALPRQRTQVILPVSSMKPTEIFAPNFENGERVALIRFPHAGTFEIPELTVNNKNRDARRIIGPNAKDAVGIHHSVAERLSGADFDGDTVLVIPNNKGSIKSTPALDGLRNFDTMKYKLADDDPTPRVDSERKQSEMGKITNLIADMNVRGAGPSDMARAVRHSMVVIDSEKHGLDLGRSARENNIRQLKAKYQEGSNRGASTLITRAGSSVRVDEYKLRPAAEGGPIDRATGKKVYKKDPESFVNRNGETIIKKEWKDRLSIIDDAHELVSSPNGTRIERVYADHSNQLKALANTARKEFISVIPPRQNKEARLEYAQEVGSLKASLNIAIKNAPLERQAQVLANAQVRRRQEANPEMDASQRKKIEAQAVAEARIRTGAKKIPIPISDREWAAIQAGAVSSNVLTQILANTDLDRVRELATPRTTPTISAGEAARAKIMLDRGYTQAEVAAQLGVKLSTLKLSISE